MSGRLERSRAFCSCPIVVSVSVVRLSFPPSAVASRSVLRSVLQPVLRPSVCVLLTPTGIKVGGAILGTLFRPLLPIYGAIVTIQLRE